MARRNTYREDEVLETPFDYHHLLRASVYIKKYVKWMVIAFTMSAVGGIMGLFTPMFSRKALDEAIPNKDTHMLFLLVALLIGTYVVGVVFTTIRSRIMVDVSQNIIFDIRKDIFDHLQKLPFQYYDDRPHGKILIRVVNYVNSVSDMLSNGLINVVLEIINLIFIVIFMFLVDVKLSLVVMAGVPILGVFMMYIKKRQRRAWQMVSNKNSNLNAYLQENIVGAKITQIFAREEENLETFCELSDRCRGAWMKAVKYSNLVWPGIDDISVCVRAAIFIFGLVIFGAGNTSLGTIVAISSYASRFWQPIMNLGNIFNNFINNIAYLERIFETLDEPVVVCDAPDAVEMKPIKGQVTFDHVTFGYEADKTVLRDLSFTVEPGESVALVGPTGAGKSTIVNLISRFYNVNSGRVLIDGQDISKVTLHSLRSQMGIMLQDSFIFSGTIEDNIRYGRLDATHEEVVEAARRANIHEYVQSLPDGYDTVVGERGVRLSGGQKQRLSIARVFLKNPPILILDEATSALDSVTEAKIQASFDRLCEGRTSIIIAHRLSTIRNADRIAVIDREQVLEQGTHRELMDLNGEYASLVRAQEQLSN